MVYCKKKGLKENVGNDYKNTWINGSIRLLTLIIPFTEIPFI